MREYDDWYGLVGNIVKYMVLNEIMDKDSADEYRKSLKKQDKNKYMQYLEYENSK